MNRNTPDEINLMDYIQVIRKRKWLIIFGTLLCVVAVGVVSLVMPKIYRGEVTFKITPKEIVTAKEMVSVIGNLDKEKRRQVLPKTYNLTDSIQLSPVRDSADKFRLIIEAKRADNIPIAISEFVEYINNNPIIKRYVEQHKEVLLKQTEELSKVIESSKELVKTYDNLIKAGRLIPVGFNPVDLNKRISDIKIEKLQVEQSLNTLEGIEMAAQPYISSKPVKPKKGLNVTLAGVVGLFVSIMIAFFMEYLQRNKSNVEKPV